MRLSAVSLGSDFKKFGVLPISIIIQVGRAEDLEFIGRSPTWADGRKAGLQVQKSVQSASPREVLLRISRGSHAMMQRYVNLTFWP